MRTRQTSRSPPSQLMSSRQTVESTGQSCVSPCAEEATTFIIIQNTLSSFSQLLCKEQSILGAVSTEHFILVQFGGCKRTDLFRTGESKDAPGEFWNYVRGPPTSELQVILPPAFLVL